MKEKTLAEDLREEAERLRRRFIHHTRPRGLLTLEQAIELCERMNAVPEQKSDT